MPATSPGQADAAVSRTPTFIEAQFSGLKEDIAALWTKVVMEIKDVRCDVVEMGQQVDTLEQGSDAKEEEHDTFRHELLEILAQNMELQLHLEDLENRCLCSNIRI
ncbi:hypothetical protein NDU88_002994 [Pleurodeles waltl]|uniref:Uncharacterized protein n=1 Tax=Pleurodeles waltl TaxID=8319 RepID=A0AAV7KWX6_PLEWA|nr:hypothetical protein NDU88_002994 [Pleurodeles waltl]